MRPPPAPSTLVYSTVEKGTADAGQAKEALARVFRMVMRSAFVLTKLEKFVRSRTV